MKCLPSNKIPLAHGNVLHDWHAEVLAIRTFNRFLVNECLLLSKPPYPPSEWVRARRAEELAEHEQQAFTIQEDVQIHMYCSEAPCGDASMELVMDAQDDATPWTSVPPTVATLSSDAIENTDEPLPSSFPSALRGRANFSHLGAVRCKPSRSDAPPTLSKSCTDKLDLKQATSLLSSITSTLISPRNAYIQSLVLPSSQYVPTACERAFTRTGRLKSLSDDTVASWKGGYTWNSFTIQPTTREFKWSRRAVLPTQKAVASNLSAIWTPSWQETLIGGVLQGRKQFDPRGASAICRRSIWKTAVEVAGIVGVPLLAGTLEKRTYEDVKTDEVFQARKKVKHDVKHAGLQGWIRNAGDSEFSLDD
ncbi:adenosine deaminase/editase [Paraphoma chrysanthemicola]|uniref:Adenosine deaminase/editase n=1 Tax=Paraphoma chrysanthemicola TaxID=798071 RepID=A0A8K0VVY0_9PLEO|nr:adenosine deaminase/editase [Paraphoma chrysanthemicola]